MKIQENCNRTAMQKKGEHTHTHTQTNDLRASERTKLACAQTKIFIEKYLNIFKAPSGVANKTSQMNLRN